MGIKGCVNAHNNSVVGDHRVNLYHEENFTYADNR